MPEITDILELRFKIPGSRQSLRVRQVTPRSANSDFIATQAAISSNPSVRKDLGMLSGNSSAGIAESKFYTGKALLPNYPVGQDLYILNSANKVVTIVELDDN